MWHELKAKYCGISRKRVESFVKNCWACCVHQPLKEKDIVRNITATHSWERIQIDLIDLRSFSDINSGYSWILHIIDVYSKFSFVFPLKSKSSEEVNIFCSNFRSL